MGKLWVYLDPSIEISSKVSIEPISKVSTEPDLSGEIRALQAHLNTLTEQLAKADAELAVLRPLATETARLEAESTGLKAQIKVTEALVAENGKMLDNVIALLTEQRAKRRWWSFK